MNDFSTRIIIIGLGNPILGDDGIGWRVVDQLPTPLLTHGYVKVDIEHFAEGGLRLMELMIGYDYAIIIDAITTYQHPLGWVICVPIENLPDLSAEHITSPHNTSLQASLHLGREVGLHLPHQVFIIGIETQRIYEFSEELTKPIQDSIPIAAHSVHQVLLDILKNQETKE